MYFRRKKSPKKKSPKKKSPKRFSNKLEGVNLGESVIFKKKNIVQNNFKNKEIKKQKYKVPSSFISKQNIQNNAQKNKKIKKIKKLKNTTNKKKFNKVKVKTSIETYEQINKYFYEELYHLSRSKFKLFEKMPIEDKYLSSVISHNINVNKK